MASELPPELAALLAASSQEQAESAWASFVAYHNKLLLQAARSLGADYDGVMDRYAFGLTACGRTTSTASAGTGRMAGPSSRRGSSWWPDALASITTASGMGASQ